MIRRQIPVVGASLLAGLLFGFGLALAQMTDPEKIKDFLDFTAIPAGGWDPSLAFVMGGALLTAMIFFRLDRGMRRPLLAPVFSRPTAKDIDARLIGGSAIFGIGWGLSGLCPGPAVANLAVDPLPAIVYVVAMLAGSWTVGSVMHTGGYGLAIADAPAD